MHEHDHSATDRIGWAFFLNVCFTIIELIGGWWTNSTAIMADAIHDLGDSLSIGFAWGLSKLSGKKEDRLFTYGYQRFSLLAALINSIVLVAGSIWILSEAIPRLTNPEMPHVEGMLALAILGVAVNGFAAYKLSHGKTLNERVLNWHLLEDVLGWVAVLVVSIVLYFVEWPILDPLLSIGFTLFILFNVARNLITTVKLFLQAVPDQSLIEKVQKTLGGLTRAKEVHHLHLWSLDGEHHVLTVHIIVDQWLDNQEQAAFKATIADVLAVYELAHTTVELEFPDEQCRDATAVSAHTH